MSKSHHWKANEVRRVYKPPKGRRPDTHEKRLRAIGEVGSRLTWERVQGEPLMYWTTTKAAALSVWQEESNQSAEWWYEVQAIQTGEVVVKAMVNKGAWRASDMAERVELKMVLDGASRVA